MSDTVDTSLMLRLEASLRKFERQMEKAQRVGVGASDKIQKRFDWMNGRVSNSAQRSADVIARSINKAEAEYQQLIGSMDPVADRAFKMAKAEGILSEALKRGVIDANQHSVAMEKLSKKYGQAGAAASAAAVTSATGMGRMVNVSKQGRFVLQNTAAQLGDIAVQAEMGTDPMRIMAQQMPQLIGGFGALSGVMGTLAPLLSVVAAVGFPIAGLMLTMGNNSEESAEKVKTFADALDAADAAISRANDAAQIAAQGSAEDLGEIYGVVTEKVRDLAFALAQIEERAAIVSFDQMMDMSFGEEYRTQLEDTFGVVGAAIANSTSEGAEQAAEEIRTLIKEVETEIATLQLNKQPIAPELFDRYRELREELAAVEGRVQEIGSLAGELAVPADVLASYRQFELQLQAAREAGDFSGVADALSEMRRLLDLMGDQIDQSVKDKLTQAESAARKMAKMLGDAAESAADLKSEASGIGGSLGPGVSAAQRLAHWFGVSLRRATALANMGDQGVPAPGKPKVYSGRGGDPRDQGGSSFDWNTRDAIEFEESDKPARSGSGGGSKADPFDLIAMAEKELTAFEQRIEMIGKTKAELAALTFKHKMLAEAKKRNIDLDKVQAGSGETLREQIERQSIEVERLAEKYDRAAERQEFFSNQQKKVKDGLLDAIVAGGDFASVLGDVAKAFARAALEAALFGSGPMSGGGGGLFGTLLGGLFGGAKPAAAANIGRAVVPAAAKAPAAPLMAAAAPAARQIDVSVGFDEGSGEFFAKVRQDSGAMVAAGLNAFDTEVLPQRVRSIAQNPYHE